MDETYRVKEYPLQVEGTTDGSYFSKGWQPKAEFVEAAHYEALFMDEGPRWTEEDVKYEVWRCMPDFDESDPKCRGTIFFTAVLGTRGAFPVTVVG